MVLRLWDYDNNNDDECGEDYADDDDGGGGGGGDDDDDDNDVSIYTYTLGFQPNMFCWLSLHVRLSISETCWCPNGKMWLYQRISLWSWNMATLNRTSREHHVMKTSELSLVHFNERWELVSILATNIQKLSCASILTLYSDGCSATRAPFLLTWFNLNPRIDS